MKKKVICYIQAFNCEKTIEAAMRSVQAQTYDNWLCFVLSNGNQDPNPDFSSNRTMDIIQRVAAEDIRFIPLNKLRNSLDMYTRSLVYLAHCFPDDYVCSLDSDDEYQPDFFERAVEMAETHQLDIVACGTEILLKEEPGAEGETLLNRRALPENLIVRGRDFNLKFPVYKPFFNEVWGKLYRSRLFIDAGYREEDMKKRYTRLFLPDTLFTIEALSHCKKFGILSGTSHKFYQFVRPPKFNATRSANSDALHLSSLNPLTRNRFSVYQTHQTLMDFLRSYGEISPELYEYMQAVLVGWFYDVFSRTLIPISNERVVAHYARRLVFNPKFEEVMYYQDSGQYNNLKNFQARINFCTRLRNFLLYQEIIRNREWRSVYHLKCDAGTRRKLRQTIAKLDEIVEKLSAMRKQE